MPGDLRRRGADAAAHGVDQHPLARGQPPPGHQRVVGGEEHLGDRRRLARRRAPRESASASSWCTVTSSACAPPPTSPITRSPTFQRVHAPHRLHLAGVFQPGDVGRPAGRRRVLAAALDQVRPVEPRGVHPHADVSGAYLGLGHLAERDDLGAAGAGVDDCAHPPPPLKEPGIYPPS